VLAALAARETSSSPGIATANARNSFRMD